MLTTAGVEEVVVEVPGRHVAGHGGQFEVHRLLDILGAARERPDADLIKPTVPDLDRRRHVRALADPQDVIGVTNRLTRPRRSRDLNSVDVERERVAVVGPRDVGPGQELTRLERVGRHNGCTSLRHDLPDQVAAVGVGCPDPQHVVLAARIDAVAHDGWPAPTSPQRALIVGDPCLHGDAALRHDLRRIGHLYVAIQRGIEEHARVLRGQRDSE